MLLERIEMLFKIKKIEKNSESNRDREKTLREKQML